MIDVNRQYDSHLGARLLDFFSAATPWHRGLWGIGLVLKLKEILEASEAVRHRVLNEPALKELAGSTMALAGRDPGLGDRQQHSVLQDALRSDIRYLGLDFRVLQQLVANIEPKYLARWASALRGNPPLPKAERAARAVAGHLLDSGFSAGFLHRWWAYKLRHEPGVRAIADLIDDANALACQVPREFRVLVAFGAFTKRQDSMPFGWLDAPAVSRWLRDRGFDVQDLRQKGGIIVSVTARDPEAAVDIASERMDRFAARVVVGSDREFVPIPKAWVDGDKHEFRFPRGGRKVNVHALERERQVFADGEYSRVDAAIELLEPLASSSPATAVASGWAAFEALLSEPGDHAIVADRMGAIVACSFPRAELTALSYRVAKLDPALGSRLGQCTTNRDRADVVAKEITAGALLPLSTASDRAAAERMRKVLSDPYPVLRDIEGYARNTFRRLYRQRNLALHGGKTDGVALRASVRTVAPLAGAGMDRIAHAWYVDRILPLELAARARISLDTVGGTDAAECVDLLARRQ